MMQKQTCEDNRKKYRIPGGASYQLRSKNAVYISPHNSIKHEIAKCIGAYMVRKWGDIKFSRGMLMALDMLEEEIEKCMMGFAKQKVDFITEAVPKIEPDRRVDLVRLSDNQRFEFETSKKIKKQGAFTFHI